MEIVQRQKVTANDRQYFLQADEWLGRVIKTSLSFLVIQLYMAITNQTRSK